ncbi:MAG: hypothetical protein IT372_07810 [Polyangiaceae bacterium]|nr:hypothetical protein [Polyangiaceae bacterium]
MAITEKGRFGHRAEGARGARGVRRFRGPAAIGALALLAAGAPAACGRTSDKPDLVRGRAVWFNNTYGGEKFFAFLANNPDPARRIRIGFENVLRTPRRERFQRWGTINDPDCVAGPKGEPDVCPDPRATGVIGIRRFRAPDGSDLYGVSCASCHAGFDPLRPPADASEPRWENIHATIGNPYLDTGAFFAANLAKDDPRRVLFESWPRGTVDTTLLFDDNIRNPTAFTPIWGWEHRPAFHVGPGEPALRNGWGGEDDLGLPIAAMRVYTNIGVCFAECVAPDPTAPIDPERCRAQCKDFPPDRDLRDLEAFLTAVEPPRFPQAPADKPLYERGRLAFEATCARCHTLTGEAARVLSNDEVNPLDSDWEDAENECRARSPQWQEGKLWARFSSDVYKRRVAAGERGYRTMMLAGVWATAPLLHNESIGEAAPATASPARRAEAYRAAMKELLASSREPRIETSPIAIGPFPAGTPVTTIFSRDPATGAVLCDDVVENRGHRHGAGLPDADKEALIYWLQFQ